MDMVMSIALAGLTMHTSRMMTDINVVLMDKVLDLTEAQGEAVQKVTKLSSPSSHVLDVYAQGTVLQTGRKFLLSGDGQR